MLPRVPLFRCLPHATRRSPRSLHSKLLVACILFAALGANTGPARASDLTVGITKIPRGTWIGPKAPDGWSDIVFVSSPRVTHGDVASLSSTVKRYAEMLHFVVLANVQQDSNGANGSAPFQLKRLGFGLAVSKGGALQIVTGPDSERLDDPELGILDSQVVSSAGDSLNQMRVVARRTTFVLLDSPAVFHQNGSNQHRVMRMLVWVDPKDGKLGQLLWLLREKEDGSLTLALDHAVYLPTPFHEKRRLLVDEDEFNLLGLPNEKAFALLQLPPGRRIPLTGQLTQILSRSQYSTEQLGQLVQLITSALR